MHVLEYAVHNELAEHGIMLIVFSRKGCKICFNRYISLEVCSSRDQNFDY